jgi:hypothetical protein
VAASAVAVAGITGIQDVASFAALITVVSGALYLLSYPGRDAWNSKAGCIAWNEAAHHAWWRRA